MKELSQRWLSKGLIQSSGKSLGSFSRQTCSWTLCPLYISLLPSVFEKTDKWRQALLRHTKAQTCFYVSMVCGHWPADSSAVGCYWELGITIDIYLSIDSKTKNSEIVLELFFLFSHKVLTNELLD